MTLDLALILAFVAFRAGAWWTWHQITRELRGGDHHYLDAMRRIAEEQHRG